MLVLVLLGLAGYGLSRPQLPGEVALGPTLAAVAERQVLRVGVRSYPRPSATDAALEAVPDEFDQALAQALGQYLGVPVVLLGASADDPGRLLREARVDLLIAGSLALPGAATGPVFGHAALSQPPAGYRQGGLLVLRNRSLPAAGSLAGQSVCLAVGSPWRADVVERGARVQPYASSIRAAVAFMSGECSLLADEQSALKVLQSQDDWRFYRLLPDSLAAAEDASIYLPRQDPQSQKFLQAALADWKRRGGQEQAWALRSSTLIVDSLKLAEGLMCH
ncbi:polar amino acid transport system substrate-binding protein [Pseudomonas flavescens]|uniref:Polar amino acid transport system substrate-binding protein n=1 Tax=Phytopseudomonas flavescens TaxID=29435 RepID=A0A1G8KD88_9GAMM|nr:polar amino acid transport system substrate-binding protein [Pseudomonas flavescens]